MDVYKRVALLVVFLALCSVPRVGAQQVDVITKITEPVNARVGSSAVLNCTVSSTVESSAQVEWVFLNFTGGEQVLTRSCTIQVEHNTISGREKNEIICPEGDGATRVYSLRINMLSIPDNGVYQCRVRQSGQGKSIQTMNVKLMVLSPPKMITSASDIVADSFLGHNVTLNCYAEGIPAPNVTWGRANGKPLPQDRARQYRVNQTNTQTVQRLEITDLTKDDRGTYRCSADNNIRPPDDYFAKISIEFSPTVSPVEPSYGAAVGNNNQATLWCKVEGNPRPTMFWYQLSTEDSKRFREGDLVITSDYLNSMDEILTDAKYLVEQKIMNVGSLSTMESMFYSLTLLNVEAGDLGTYVCRARNTHDDGWSTVELYQVTPLKAQASTGATLMPFMAGMFVSYLLTVLH